MAFSEKTDTPAVNALPVGVQTLTLLSETEDAVVPAVKLPDKKSNSKKEDSIEQISPSRSCYSLGPILGDDNLKN